MITFRENIWQQGEYTYEAAYGFEPNIRGYLHDDKKIRKCMLVVPGGGYCMVVPPEAEIVAKEFYNRGYNAFVLTYTTDITMSVPLKKQPLNDISRAVRYIRKNSEKYFIDVDKLTVCGFSAGAHVCGTLCTHFDDAEEFNDDYKDINNRPDNAILSYPVINTREFTHVPSVEALLGKTPSEKELDYFSLEKNVTENTPPCFIWQTVDDELVPVENSYLMANSLRHNKIPYAHYVFPSGFHGLSVATEEFFKGVFGEEYTMEQLKLAIENVKNGTAINVSEQRTKELMEQFFGDVHSENSDDDSDTEKNEKIEKTTSEINPFEDVKMWPDMANVWIERLYKK